ncbi:MAG TPA: ATP-binding protein [Longimicrobiaceae bacterium]|nr:ATP-binding protein [Longimicrobiaceae bacterium]
MNGAPAADATRATPDAPHPPEGRGSRILLLLDQPENRSLLAGELSRDYVMVPVEDDDALDGEFDLCVVDGRALDRLWERVQRRKATEHPAFLPVLLVTSRPGVKMITRHVWRSVDELIVAPIERPELRARVEILLRARTLSLELRRRADEASALAQRLEQRAAEMQAQSEALERRTLELQATTEKLEERTGAAEEANRVKSQFLATMSHELRTPLNAIAGYVQLLEMGLPGPVNAEQLRYLARIDRAQGVLLGLIDDVLSYARLEAGRIDYRSEPVPLAPLLERLEELVAPQLGERGLTWSCSTCGPDLAARGDAERILQILLNLASNAVKFTDPGGEVRVSAGAEGKTVQVRVADTGWGIPPERLREVFDPFVQVDRSRGEESQKGVGLGLAISRGMARAMGGSLDVESTPGVGSTFTLTLPRADAEE